MNESLLLGSVNYLNKLMNSLVIGIEPMEFGSFSINLERFYHFIPPDDVNHYGMHMHPHFDFFHVRMGTIQFEVDGFSFQVKKGEFGCIPPGVIHSWKIIQRPLMLDSFKLSINSHNTTPSNISNDFSQLCHDNLYHFKEIADAENLFEAFSRGFLNEQNIALGRSRMGNYLELILICFFDCHLKNNIAKENESENQDLLSSASNAHWKRLVSFLEVNQTHNLSIENMTTALEKDSFYLNRLCQFRTGYTIPEYNLVIKTRISREMLTNGKSSIKEIAYSLGFSDPSHFSRFFRKYNDGDTPSDFRKKFSKY